MGACGHEQVALYSDPASGLRAIVAIHSTELGPALGGCRMFPYASEADALHDVLRLSEGMTYKAALAGLNLGGGKAVLWGHPKKDKSERLWRAFGRFVAGLNGRYITAEDVGTTLDDMEAIRHETVHVVGTSRALGGSGDPSPITALGVYAGMRAAVEVVFDGGTLAGKHVAVQGCGNVGYHLVGHLVRAGARVSVADVDAEATARTVRDFGATEVLPQNIATLDCDVFAPCAMGAVLNPTSIPALRCRVVAGAANNQLRDERADGAALSSRGIVYAPDYAINAGGLINVANEQAGYDQERAIAQTQRIYGRMHDIFARAQADDVPTALAAGRLAKERIASLGAMRRTVTSAGSFHAASGV